MDGVIRQLGAIALQLAQAIEKALLEMPDFRTMEAAIIRATQEAARRYSKDRQSGAGRFLLDEVLGLEPRQRYSPLVQEFGIQLCTQVSYPAAAEWLDRVTCGAVRLSAMALWEDVQAAGARADEVAKAQREAVFERGEIAAGSRPAAAVDLKFDELLIRGRRRGPDGKKERMAHQRPLSGCRSLAHRQVQPPVLQHRPSPRVRRLELRGCDGHWPPLNDTATRYKVRRILIQEGADFSYCDEGSVFGHGWQVPGPNRPDWRWRFDHECMDGR